MRYHFFQTCLVGDPATRLDEARTVQQPENATTINGSSPPLWLQCLEDDKVPEGIRRRDARDHSRPSF